MGRHEHERQAAERACGDQGAGFERFGQVVLDCEAYGGDAEAGHAGFQ